MILSVGCSESEPRAGDAGARADVVTPPPPTARPDATTTSPPPPATAQVGVRWEPGSLTPAPESAGVYLIRLGDASPSCTDVEEGRVDAISTAPDGALVAMDTVPWAAGGATVAVEPGRYLLIVEAYAPPPGVEGELDIVGVGCAMIEVESDGNIPVEIVPAPGRRAP
jgi:hypothetical protein